MTHTQFIAGFRRLMTPSCRIPFWCQNIAIKDITPKNISRKENIMPNNRCTRRPPVMVIYTPSVTITRRLNPIQSP